MLTALLYAATTSTLVLDVLPDAGLWEARLADAYVGTTFSSETPPNAKAIRMSTVSINRGPGRLELRGGTVVGDLQKVLQRVFRDDGTTYDREAGWFVYHPAHGHIHFEDWTVFRLRQMTPEGGVGPVIRTGAKTSFCILELDTWDSSLPGYNTSPSYSSCGQVQGLRPGRADIYSSSLNGQYIEIEGVPNGIYWLEGEIDPDNLVLEADETNNFARIPFAIGPPPTAVPDAFEENDSISEVNAKVEGAANSPNIGLVLSQMVLKGLSMDDANDYFKIKLHACGPGDYLKVESPYLRQGNINLRLLNSSGSLLRSSTGSYNYEQISLNGIGAGTYFVHVQRSGTTSNPLYNLTVEPGGNLPPNITVTQPALPGMWVERSLETFPVAWNGTDPDGDPKFVTIFMDRNRVFGPTNMPIPGYENINGGTGGVNINTVGLGLGKWNIFVRATDGAAFSDVWAPGFVGLYLKGDLNFDGVVTETDLGLLKQFAPKFENMPDGYNPVADMNRDGRMTIQDVSILGSLLRGG